MAWIEAEPPSRDLQAILDQIDAEDRARKRTTFEACADCTSYEIRDLCDAVAQTYWQPCSRHAWAAGGITGEGARQPLVARRRSPSRRKG